MNPEVFEDVTSFIQHRCAITHAERAANAQRAMHDFMSGWPKCACVDFGDDIPRFGFIYAVLFTAPATVWFEECLCLFVRHEIRSLVFLEELPDSYLAALFEAWPQLAYLTANASGRSNENFTFSYIGKVLHDESLPLSRPGACGIRAGCSSAILMRFTTGRGAQRRVVSPMGMVRRADPQAILAVLPRNCPLALGMTETLLQAFCAGSGVVFLNYDPTARKTW